MLRINNNKNSDTPETNHAAFMAIHIDGDGVPTEFARQLERERDEWKAKYIQQNKDLGCELRDPNGTIWDHAKTLQSEVEHLKSQLTQTQGCVTISRNGYVQELERELAEAREVLREIRDNEVNPEDEADKFLRDHAPSELSKVRDQRDRLAEALDELIITEGRGLDQWERDAFAKAKQAIAAVKGEEQ
jgi:hypothetical protein